MDSNINAVLILKLFISNLGKTPPQLFVIEQNLDIFTFDEQE